MPAMIHGAFITYILPAPTLGISLAPAVSTAQSGPQGLEDQPQGQHRKRPVNPVPCQDQGTEPRLLSSDHVRHDGHNSSQTDEPDRTRADPIPHRCSPPLPLSCDACIPHRSCPTGRTLPLCETLNNYTRRAWAGCASGWVYPSLRQSSAVRYCEEGQLVVSWA